MAQSDLHIDSKQETSHPRARLPPEIWNYILARTDTRALVNLVQASRDLFNLTIPYLWRYVNITIVLALLPGSSNKHPRDPGAFEIEIPPILPDNYFERLDIYAPHVQSIGYHQAWSVPQDCSRHMTSWPAIARCNADHPLLPNLKGVCLEGRGYFSHQLYVALDWIGALVLPGTNLIQCTFDLSLEGIDTAVKDKARHTLGLILSQSPMLRYLSLQSYDAWDVIEPSGNNHFIFQDIVPQSLTYLAVTTELLTGSSLFWIAQMSKLKRLQFSSPGLTAQHIMDCSTVILPRNSFSELRCLELTTSILGAAKFLWRTPMVEKLTEARIYGGRNWDTRELLPLVAERSPQLTKLELCIRIDSEVDPRVLASLEPLPLCELKIGLTKLASSSALQTIGSILPALVLIDLSLTVIDLNDLLHVHESLPKLKQLIMNLPTEISSEIKDLANTYRPPKNDTTWRVFSFTLISRGIRWIRQSDWDVLARLLALSCPHIKLILSDEKLVGNNSRQSLQDKVSEYGRQFLAMAES